MRFMSVAGMLHAALGLWHAWAQCDEMLTT